MELDRSMETVWSLPFAFETDLPDRFDAGDDVRFPPTFAERAIRTFSEPGDVVFDPFAGFGTTLAVAERLDRRPVGLEYEHDRAAFIRGRVGEAANVRQGDLFELDVGSLPPADCVVTSPPFMVEGMRENPFENYAGWSDYDSYLGDVREGFDIVSGVVVDGGTLAIEVANIRFDGEVTTLAADVVDAVSAVDGLRFDREIVLNWEGDTSKTGTGGFDDGVYGYGYDHSYCLVFEADGS